MGDRAVVLFEGANGIEPFAVYFHWAGAAGVRALCDEALARLAERRGDVSYFAARFVGIAHEHDKDSVTGMGLLAAPTAAQYADPAAMKEYSHGDAGVAVLNPAEGTLRWIDGTGYGATQCPA